MNYKIQDIGRFLLGYFIYIGSAGMGLELALWENLAPLIWPPAGFGLGFLLLCGVRFWPMIFFGSLTVSYFETTSILPALLIALGYSASAIITVLILKRYFSFRNEMERIQDVGAFVFFAVLLAPLLSAGAYTFAFSARGLLTDFEPFTYYSVRWLSDALGTLSLTPFLIVWFAKTRMNWRDHQAFEVLLWLSVLIFLGAMVFRNWAPSDTLRYPLELAMFPLTAWAAIRFGQRGVTLAVLIVSLMAVWELRDVISPEATRTITQPPGYLWVFVGVLSITSFFLAAVLTELRVREELTRTNEERLAGFIRALPDLAFVFSKEGKFEEVFAPKLNPLHAAIESWKGRHLTEIYPAGLAMAFEESINRVVSSGDVEVLRYAMAVNGSDRWFEGRFAPVDSGEGSTQGVIAFAYDVTLTQRAQQELHYRDRLLQTLTEAESELLRRKGREYEVGLSTAFNTVGKGTSLDWIELFVFDYDTYGTLSGTIQSEHRWIRGDSFADSIFEINPEFLTAFQADWIEKLKGGYSLRAGAGVETSHNKTELPSELIGIRSLFIYPLFVNQRLHGFVLYASTIDDLLEDVNLKTILRSISESLGSYIESKIIELELLSAKETAETADLAKGEFLAMMSHEIRTPMNAIVGFADLLKKTKLTEDQEEFIGIINRSGKELLDLINNILDFSKLESNRIDLEETAFYLETTAVEALEMVLMKARSKEINLDYEIHDDSSGVYIGDPLRLRQVLVNLLSNSVKFTKVGDVKLIIHSTVTANANRRSIKMVVKDTGIGIPKEKIFDLFKPFEQLDSSTTREFGGTGLGLTIVDRIVSKMNGQIDIQSEVDKGTEITVSFELESELNEVAGGSHHIPKADETSIHMADAIPLNILVVENNQASARLLSEILTRLGYEPKIVETAEECIKSLKRGSYDVIFMDMNLAELNGLEATERIRKGFGGLQHADITIIASTAHALAEEKAQIMESGVNYYLIKPIQLEDVRLALLHTKGKHA